jgi:hypothetical protein
LIPDRLSRYTVTLTLLLLACWDQSFWTPSAVGYDEEIIVVLDVEKPPIAGAVDDPDGSSICSSIIHSSPVVLKPVQAQGDFVPSFQRIPQRHAPA